MSVRPARWMRCIIAAMLLGCGVLAWAAGYEHGGMVRVATIYLTPDRNAAKLAELGRGREVIILEGSRGWLHVEANVSEEKTITGWILDKGVIRTSTPDGDRILFGEAVDSEDEASRRHGRHNAAEDARFLYQRVYETFPTSPLAAEAMYRAADIRWQIDKQDVMSKPSAKEKDAFLRGEIDEHWMKEVMKKFPGTKWADLAAFHLIDNKLCGDWQGASKCPEKEAEIYEKFAADRPQSPVSAEALYDAAYRRSALIEIYKTEEQPKKIDETRSRAIGLAQKVISQFPQSDWAARAQRLLYLVQQGIPTFGNEVE